MFLLHVLHSESHPHLHLSVTTRSSTVAISHMWLSNTATGSLSRDVLWVKTHPLFFLYFLLHFFILFQSLKMENEKKNLKHFNNFYELQEEMTTFWLSWVTQNTLQIFNLLLFINLAIKRFIMTHMAHFMFQLSDHLPYPLYSEGLVP